MHPLARQYYPQAKAVLLNGDTSQRSNRLIYYVQKMIYIDLSLYLPFDKNKIALPAIALETGLQTSEAGLFLFLHLPSLH